MHAIYELKDMLCDELEKYGEKSNLSTGELDVVHKLAETVKNLCKIIDMCEDDEYSGAYDDMGMPYGGGMRGGSYRRGGSYARGGRGGGRRGGANQYGSYARNGYSREEGNEMLVKDLRELMNDSPDERTKQEFHKFIKKIEQM